MTSLAIYAGGVALVGLERVVELLISARNARIAFARGAVEVGQAHYRVMAAFHTLFLVACVGEAWAFERPFPGPIGWTALVGCVLAQALRYWAIATLGDRWNTRIIFVPDATPVTGGPYRFLRHPNYLAVLIEFSAIPLAVGAWRSWLVLTLLHTPVLVRRIRSEEALLDAVPGYASAMGDKPRFVPRTAGRVRDSTT